MDIQDKTKEELIIILQELLQVNNSLKVLKEKRAAELGIANIELVLQGEEKEKRAAELGIANIELDFQNEEKEKRAAELIIANKELLFQNEEKEKRAVELIIANKELVHQNELKEKRAAELIIANKELLFQNEEKEKRAAELIIANKELLFQNEEKEKRAADLIIAISNAEEFEKKFKQIAENIDEVFWLRTDSEMIYISPSFEKIWGVPCQDIYTNPQKFTEIVHPDDRQKVHQIFKSDEFVEKGLFNYEFRILRVDNQVRWINAKTVPIIDASGKVMKRVGIANDITEKQQSIQELIKAKEKAEESEANYRILFEKMPDGVYKSTHDGKFVKTNPAMVKMLGYNSEEELLAVDIKYDLYAEDSERDNISLNELNQELGIFQLRKKDGSVIWVEDHGWYSFDESGEITYHEGIMRNVTERIQKEEELIKAKEHAEESDRLKSAFLSNMSHEIRTPMNGILGFAELLKEPGLTGETQQEYIRIIEKSGARMLNIINDIVDISKIEAGLMQVNFKETNINEKIKFIYTFFKPQTEEKGINFLFKNALTEKEAIIKSDNEKVYSILTNLVKNAIKYTEEGVIELGYTLRRTQNTVDEPVEPAEMEFYVKDTGIGIPKDRQEAIFERFIQADITDKMAQQGAGLGLSISKAYVEMLGGKIWVKSDEGKGSIFYFTLPYQTEPEEKIIPKNEDWYEKSGCKANPEVSGLNILVAEDDETSEMLLSALVKEHTTTVLKASTGIEAVDICRNNPDIDLVLMDIQMPGLNGYEATRQIRQFNKDVIIIAQTAFGLSGDKEKAIEAGCNDYISKPINKDKLRSLIQQYFKK